MASGHKYARIDWERRFLLADFPGQTIATRVRRISDRYIEGTRLRLRQQEDREGPVVFKLTQKIAEKVVGARQGMITTLYLAKEEYDGLAKLPAKVLTKTRYSVPPFGIDVFEGCLTGLVLAEAEFDSAEEASALVIPWFVVREVSADPRFTGGHLVTMSHQEVTDLLVECGIERKAGSSLRGLGSE